MNTRFAVATHLLSFLTFARDRLVTSDEIADSVNTHPALVRRTLSLLREAGLVETQLGPGGGARLARAPEHITLLDVYEASETDDDLFAVGRISPNRKCPVGANIQTTLENLLAPSRRALRQALSQVTVADVFASATAQAQSSVPTATGAPPPVAAVLDKDYGIH